MPQGLFMLSQVIGFPFLWLNNIPVCVRVRVCERDIFFIHSSVDGQPHVSQVIRLIVYFWNPANIDGAVAVGQAL